MSQPAVKREPPRSFLARILYFCLHPVMLIIIAAVISAVFLAVPFGLLITPITLPDFAGPEQEAFWTLQKKLLDIENAQAASVTLTQSEFNAFLTGYQLPPEDGFCLQRLRCSTDNASATLYVIGSGFFMRSLVFQLGISVVDAQLRVERLQINSLSLSDTDWATRYVLQYLKNLAMKNAEGFVARIIEGKGKVEFADDLIVLKGEFMPVRPKQEAEELPTVEIETEQETADEAGN
ncbi:MAG: hypothetical protein ACD_39C00026G0003 [uncultured bacterium]|nr:MAG: hypothetical protein ACD_39C00026G0003 [uncultured bacterium]